jgi:hypothetical protein
MDFTIPGLVSNFGPSRALGMPVLVQRILASELAQIRPIKLEANRATRADTSEHLIG